MTQGSAGRIRISIKDGERYERSILVTGSSPQGSRLVQRLQSMGLTSRRFGNIVVASGRIEGSVSGNFAEFGEACNHQTLMDATRHAVRSLSSMFREYGIEAEIGDEPPEPGLISQPTLSDQFSAWARLS